MKRTVRTFLAFLFLFSATGVAISIDLALTLEAAHASPRDP